MLWRSSQTTLFALQISGKQKNLVLDLKELYGNTYGFSKTTNSKVLEDFYVKNAETDGMIVSRLTAGMDPNEWALNHSQNLDDYIKQYLIGATFLRNDDMREFHIWYNNEALHSLPITVNLLFESLLKEVMPNRVNERLISVSNHPVPPESEKSGPGFLAITGGWFLTLSSTDSNHCPISRRFICVVPNQRKHNKSKIIAINDWFVVDSLLVLKLCLRFNESLDRCFHYLHNIRNF